MDDQHKRHRLLLLAILLLLPAAPALADGPSWSVTGGQTAAHLGAALATGGDLNGDGFSDLLIAAPDYDAGTGAVLVYHGGPAGPPSLPTTIITVTTTGAAHFGAALATGGDLNGDGYWDILIGAPDHDGGRGAAFAFYGGPAGLSSSPAWSITGPTAGGHLGATIAGAGDLNGDGFSDLLVAAPDDGSGTVFVYHGGPAGPDGESDGVLPGRQVGEHFGAALAGVGDLNGDGFDDLIIAAPGYDRITGTVTLTDTGRVVLYLGGPAGIGDLPAWESVGTAVGHNLGASLAGPGDVDGDGFTDLLIATATATLVYRGGLAGPRPSPTAITACPAAVAGAGDVNGDGFADLLLGRPECTEPAPDSGTVWLHLGGPAGPSPSPDTTFTGAPEAEGFGAALAGTGDVDGDGFSDLLIAAPDGERSATDEGIAYLYRGRPDGPTATPAWTQAGFRRSGLLGWAIAGAGDVNGDGFSDLLIAAPRSGTAEEGLVYLFPGAPGGPTHSPAWVGQGGQPWAWFGGALASGDLNGDGFTDLLIAAPRYDRAGFDDGQVSIYPGGPGGLDDTPAQLLPTDDELGTAVIGLCARFGFALATGDVDGDGYDDILITANGFDGAATNEGAAFLYPGGPSGPAATHTWETHPTGQSYADFGQAAALADLNGDGYGDIIIGAPWYDPGPEDADRDRGAVYVYYGSAAGPPAEADLVIVGRQREGQFGGALATGDVNGDGLADLFVGAYQHTPADDRWRAGAAFAFYGRPDGLCPEPDWVAYGSRQNERFGIALAGAGDVNGDGYGALLIGASDANLTAGATPAHLLIASPGAALLYEGGAAGLAETATWQGSGDEPGAGYGLAVAGVGDLNGDGFDDLAVAAPTDNEAALDGGVTFVYLGGGGRGLPVRPRQRQPVLDTASIGPWGLSRAADRVRLQLTARSPLGRGKVTFRREIAPATTPFTAAVGVHSGTAPGWSEILTTGTTLSDTISGLDGGVVYHWRVRTVYRPGNLGGQVAGRWLYPPLGKGFRTPHLLTPDRSGLAHPGGKAVYTHTLHNPLGITQTFTLTAHSAQAYTVTIAGETVLAAYATTPITVVVTIPTTVISPTWETTVITAGGRFSGCDTARDVTGVVGKRLSSKADLL